MDMPFVRSVESVAMHCWEISSNQRQVRELGVNRVRNELGGMAPGPASQKPATLLLCLWGWAQDTHVCDCAHNFSRLWTVQLLLSKSYAEKKQHPVVF